MGLLTKIKQFLPPSSRSFHSMYKEMVESNWIVKDTGLKLYDMDARFNERLDELERRLDAHDTHMKLLAWATYRREGESYDGARKRFYHELPGATGSLRLLQLGCAQLLHEFDDVCTREGLTYWLAYGTLVGALRHQGFVPWDDDVDLGMMRADVERLQEVLQTNERLMMTEVFDAYVRCRQLRVRYRDEANPCFLDVFVYDYAPSCDHELVARHQALRSAMVQEMETRSELAFWNDDDAYVDARRVEAQPIAEVFARYAAKAEDAGYYLRDGQSAAGVIWSLDNMDDELGLGQRVMPLDTYFPVERMPFEGLMLAVPHKAESLAQVEYGDILELPGDIHSHMSHVTAEELESLSQGADADASDAL